MILFLALLFLKAKIVLMMITALLYTLSPFDLVPEAVFGALGYLDDITVVVLTTYAMAGVWRSVLATG